jgi:hypothetical protein
MLFTGCLQSGPDPVQFNDRMVSLQKEIGDKMTAFGDKIGSTQTIVEADFLKDLADIKTLINTNITVLDKLPTPQGGENFKAAVKGIFVFYKDVCDKEFTEMVKLLAKPDFGEADLTTLTNLQKSVQDQETVWDKKVQDAQTAFATKYNITVQ